MRGKETRAGYLFAAPWLIGFFAFTVGPVIASFIISLTNYDMLQAPKFIGFANYTKLLFKDELFLKSVGNTLYYVIFSIPLSMLSSVAISVLLNQKVRGIRWYRTLFYLPNVVSIVAVSLLWKLMLDPNFGMINEFLAKIGIEGPGWLSDENWSKPSLILMSLWNVGGGIIIYLAALQDVPAVYHEAATIDGASAWKRFWKITFPMITPTLFYNLIMGIIGGLQVFSQSFIMTSGGPLHSTYFYAYHLYNKAFSESQMGYASAMAWVLLVFTLILSLLVMKTSNKWVYYEGGENNR